MWLLNRSQCFAFAFKRVFHVIHFYKDTILMCEPLSVQMGPTICLFKCLQYRWAREFPDFKQYWLTVYHIISNVHDPSMYTLSMIRTDTGKHLTFLFTFFTMQKLL